MYTSLVLPEVEDPSPSPPVAQLDYDIVTSDPLPQTPRPPKGVETSSSFAPSLGSHPSCILIIRREGLPVVCGRTHSASSCSHPPLARQKAFHRAGSSYRDRHTKMWKTQIDLACTPGKNGNETHARLIYIIYNI